MIVKIKKLTKNAVIPTRNTETDAGLDLTAITATLYTGVDGNFIEYGTGLAIEVPEGYVGLLFPRSSVTKKDLVLGNSVGVLDSGYRGEIKFRFKQLTASYPITEEIAYIPGDKVGQIIILPYPKVVFEVVDELEDSERGENGFGSSGK